MIEPLTSADGEAFRQLFAIYASSINAREQKPEKWLRSMVCAPEYRVWLARAAGPPGQAAAGPPGHAAAGPPGQAAAGHVLGFSILFVPPAAGFALLEYMAVAPEKRGHGLGAELFRRTVEHATAPSGVRLPVVLEIDSDREASADRAMRARRAGFYRRLGCVKISGLRYEMPLQGAGAAPEMDLMLYPARTPGPIARADLKAWLQTIYRDVYHCPPDDPRIAEMLAALPDPVVLE